MGGGASLASRLVGAAKHVSDWFRSDAGLAFQKWLSLGLSLLIVLILVRSILSVGWEDVLAALPANPWFWLVFTLSYLMLPIMDWAIYRRWWAYDWRAFGVILKKRVINEALFTYAGHTYFLVWATGFLGISYDPKHPPRLLGRARGGGVDPAQSPFAAVKDVAVMSGLAGNLATLGIVLLALWVGRDQIVAKDVDLGTLRALLLALALFLVMSVAILLFRNRLLSLPTGENVRVFWLQMLRVVLAHLFITLSWIVALPAVGLDTWILLGAIRMLIGRLPLPNVEVLFASIAVALAGEAAIAVAALMAAQGALQLLFHGLSWGAGSAIEPKGPQAQKAPAA